MLEQAVERIQRMGPGDSPFFGNKGRSWEWHTRYYVVDPLLRALGWDTGCPREVRIEWPVPGGGRADYALFAPGISNDPEHLYVPKALIEVKRRGARIPVEASAQLTGYVSRWPNMSGIAVITNGMVWHFYDAEGGSLLKRDPAAVLDLSQGPTRASADTLRDWLSRSKWPNWR